MIDPKYLLVSTALMEDRTLTALAKLLLTTLIFRQGTNGESWPSQDTLAEDLGASVKAIRRATLELVKASRVEIPSGGRGRRHSFRYKVILRKGDESTPFQTPERCPNDTFSPAGKGAQTSHEKVPKRPPNRSKRRRVSSVDASRDVFVPPTEAEVREYAVSRGLPDFDAGRFVEFYAVNNWHDSHGRPVRNWKQKFISTWEPKAKRQTIDPSDMTAPASPEQIEALMREGVL
jgi:predicted transcriptional regulator